MCGRTRSSEAAAIAASGSTSTGSPSARVHVIVTDGARGGSGYSAAPVPGPVVDTYGAGDTFVAGVLYGLASGWAIDRTLAFGAEHAAEALTWRGALPPRS